MKNTKAQSANSSKKSDSSDSRRTLTDAKLASLTAAAFKWVTPALKPREKKTIVFEIDNKFRVNRNENGSLAVGFGYDENGELIAWWGTKYFSPTILQSVKLRAVLERLFDAYDLNSGCECETHKWFDDVAKAMPDPENPEALIHAYMNAVEKRYAMHGLGIYLAGGLEDNLTVKMRLPKFVKERLNAIAVEVGMIRSNPFFAGTVLSSALEIGLNSREIVGK